MELAFKFVAVVVAIFGVVTYFADRRHGVMALSKRDALEVVDSYSSDKLISARRVLLEFWGDHQSFTILLQQDQPVTPREYSNFVRAALLEYDQYDAVEEALFVLGNYLDHAYYCRSSDVCDDEILDGFLCDKVMSYTEVYGPFFSFANNRIASSGFGAGFQAYRTICDNVPK